MQSKWPLMPVGQFFFDFRSFLSHFFVMKIALISVPSVWNCHLSIYKLFLLDSPIIGRVTGTAWRQLLRARNSPSPHER